MSERPLFPESVTHHVDEYIDLPADGVRSKPGFPIWLWYRIARTSRCALSFGAPT